MKRMLWIFAVVGLVCGSLEAADWLTKSDSKGWDLDFPGGSVAEYFDGVSVAFPGENIVVHPEANTVGMPSVHLKSLHERSVFTLPEKLLTGVAVRSNGNQVFGDGVGGDSADSYWIVQVDIHDVTSWVNSDAGQVQHSGYDIRFSGGTVAQYIDAVRKAAGGGMNVVMMPGVEGVMVPEISLSGVQAKDAMAVLNELRRPDGEAWARVSEVSRGVYVLRPASDERHEITREVWNLSELLSSGIGEDGILRAVEMGLGSVGDGAEVLYHEDTGLLLVVGTHDHVQVVDEILSEMHETASVREHARIRAEERLREREELELDLHRERAEMNLLHEHVFDAEGRLERAGAARRSGDGDLSGCAACADRAAGVRG